MALPIFTLGGTTYLTLVALFEAAYPGESFDLNFIYANDPLFAELAQCLLGIEPEPDPVIEPECPCETEEGLRTAALFVVDRSTVELSAREIADLDVLNGSLEIVPDKMSDTGLEAWMNEFISRLQEMNNEHRQRLALS